MWCTRASWRCRRCSRRTCCPRRSRRRCLRGPGCAGQGIAGQGRPRSAGAGQRGARSRTPSAAVAAQARRRSARSAEGDPAIVLATCAQGARWSALTLRKERRGGAAAKAVPQGRGPPLPPYLGGLLRGGGLTRGSWAPSRGCPRMNKMEIGRPARFSMRPQRPRAVLRPMHAQRGAAPPPEAPAHLPPPCIPTKQPQHCTWHLTCKAELATARGHGPVEQRGHGPGWGRRHGEALCSHPPGSLLVGPGRRHADLRPRRSPAGRAPCAPAF